MEKRIFPVLIKISKNYESSNRAYIVNGKSYTHGDLHDLNQKAVHGYPVQKDNGAWNTDSDLQKEGISVKSSHFTLYTFKEEKNKADAIYYFFKYTHSKIFRYCTFKDSYEVAYDMNLSEFLQFLEEFATVQSTGKPKTPYCLRCIPNDNKIVEYLESQIVKKSTFELWG